MRQSAKQRLASLRYISRPLALMFLGIVLASLGTAFLLLWLYQHAAVPGLFYYLLLQFIPEPWRGLLLIVVGGLLLAFGGWKLGGLAIVRMPHQTLPGDEFVISSRRDLRPSRIVVLSGGVGLMVLSELSRHVERMTCITPVQDPIEYYYRATNLAQAANLYYVVPTPEPIKVFAELNNHTLMNVMHIDHHSDFAPQHVERLFLVPDGSDPQQVANRQNGQLPVGSTTALTRLAREAIREADAIVLGPGSLFESILPNLLLDELRKEIQQSKARKVFICNLMTEPGLTTGFSVSEHIRQIKQYGGFVPDYVLVNVPRIDNEIREIYAAASQAPVYLSPEEYEETVVPTSHQVTEKQILVEGSVVIEADLASSVIQSRASITQPGESRAVRVLRHDPDKVIAVLLEVLRRG
ncbi:MAG: hypothetical protein HC893_05490 [Chloroflexaceae bacterium]|nr:hypothetical protein [Chloroflexaceae bacterium]NJL33392.1 hypothetical protein [Chloroflexaceae bacterium]NJO06354.1 hypothetical protein [Chloroflexaceae bacterium]